MKANFNLKKDNKLKEYFKAHSKGLGVSIGIFGKYNKRKQVADSGVVGTPYGIRRAISNLPSKATNYSVALKNIKGYSTPKYSVPVRNFFKKAKEKKYWDKQNFTFLKDYFKALNPNDDTSLNRLGNLGKVILKRAINDTDTPANSPFSVEKKGFNAPLRDSGQLQSSINWQNYKPFAKIKENLK